MWEILATPPGLSVIDAAMYEGDSGTTDMVFTVRLSRASDQQVTVDYDTVDGTAVGEAPLNDYQPAHGTLTFAPDVTTREIHVAVIGNTQILDHVGLFPKQFSVKLSKPDHAAPRQT